MACVSIPFTTTTTNSPTVSTLSSKANYSAWGAPNLILILRASPWVNKYCLLIGQTRVTLDCSILASNITAWGARNHKNADWSNGGRPSYLSSSQAISPNTNNNTLNNDKFKSSIFNPTFFLFGSISGKSCDP